MNRIMSNDCDRLLPVKKKLRVGQLFDRKCEKAVLKSHESRGQTKSKSKGKTKGESLHRDIAPPNEQNFIQWLINN
jgi:hypothetical protein